MATRAGFPTLTPYLAFDDAAAAFAWYQRAFGAVEIQAMRDEQGILRHGELRIGDSPIMLSNTMPQFAFMKSPAQCGGSPMHLFVYCDDADAWFARALACGARELMPLADQPYGRSGGVTDPFGYVWWITTHRD